MELDDLTPICGEWLRGVGPDSDIVMSSRIRLARNLAEFPFIRKCTDHDRASIEAIVRDRVKDMPSLADAMYLNVSDLEAVDRQFLVERQLTIDLWHAVVRVVELKVTLLVVAVGEIDVVPNAVGILLTKHLLEHKDVLFQRNLVTRRGISAANRQKVILGSNWLSPQDQRK